jgi:DNA-binding transcriptional LysR family regulator
MNWDHLRYFLAIADTGSLQGAARKLEVNHSTAFRRMNAFEKAVDTRLFERLPDGYQLTAAGEDLLEHARRIGDEIDQLQLKILGKDFRPSGSIRITAPDNIAYEYLPPYLAEFSARYPDIEFELVVGAQSLDLTRREADVAIRATQTPPVHLIGRKVVALKWGFFASLPYLDERGRPRRPNNLVGHRLIGADGDLRRIPPFRLMESVLPGQICMTCSTLNAMSAMAEAGCGIAVLPDDQIKAQLVRLFDTDPLFLTEIWVLTHPELRRTERIRLLIEHLVEKFRTDDRLHRAD